MNDLIGKKLIISGMEIEILGDAGNKWEVKNTTTNKTLLMEKAAIERSIKLGMSEILEHKE